MVSLLLLISVSDLFSYLCCAYFYASDARLVPSSDRWVCFLCSWQFNSSSSLQIDLIFHVFPLHISYDGTAAVLSTQFIGNQAASALLVASQRIAASKNNALGASAVAASATVNGGTETAPPNGEGAIEETIRLQINEKARTVLAVSTSGTLCTKSSHDGIEGSPFGSYVDYVLDDEGCPVLLMNEMSMHTVNVRDDPGGLVTLFVQLGRGSEGQDSSRCSITGKLVVRAVSMRLTAMPMSLSIHAAYSCLEMRA